MNRVFLLLLSLVVLCASNVNGEACPYCDGRGILNVDHVYGIACMVDRSQITESGSSCADLEPINGHNFEGSDKSGGVCWVKVDLSVYPDFTMTEEECTGYTTDINTEATFEYDVGSCATIDAYIAGLMAASPTSTCTDENEDGISGLSYPEMVGCCLEDTEEEPTLNPDYNVDVSFSQKYADIIEEGDDEKSMTTFATLCSFVATMQCHDIRANEDGYLIATLNGPSAQVEAARALLEEGFEYYAYDIKVQAGLPQSTTTRAPAAGTNTGLKDESSEDANMGLVAVFIIVCLLMICILCLTVRNHEEWCGTKKGESGQKTTSV